MIRVLGNSIAQVLSEPCPRVHLGGTSYREGLLSLPPPHQRI